MLSAILFGGTVYAFTALSVTTTLNVKEPLSISAATATGDLLTDGVTCTTSLDSLSATCTGDVVAGDTGGITVTVANAGHEAIMVTANAVSSSSDVTAKIPSPISVPAAATSDFAFDITVSPSATPTTGITVTLTFDR